MRFLWLAVLMLGGFLWTGTAAEARSRTEQAQSRPAATQSTRAAAARRAEAPQRQARAAQAGTRQAAGRAAAPRQQAARSTGRRQVATRSGRASQAPAACRGRNCATAPRQVTWQSGLAPATNAQAQSCPAGTLATLARGHADVVRCVPL